MFKFLPIILCAFLVGCNPSNEEKGCQQFTQLVDEVYVATVHRADTDYRTAETMNVEIEILEIESLLGIEESQLPLTPLGTVIRLENIARYYFDDTSQHKDMSWQAYNLWAAAQSVYYVSDEGGWAFLPMGDGKFAAEKLAEACEKYGHPSPSVDTNILIEFVELNCPPRPGCQGCFCDESIP